MIHFSNIVRIDNLPFDQYLKLPGYSHSFLKRQKGGYEPEFRTTRKVEIGKLVDGILTDPASVDMRHQYYRIAKDIAAKISAEFGFMITKFQKQVSFTADLEYEGLIMPGKFRLDWLVPDMGVVDLKITSEKNVRALIKYMGYDNQLFGYARAARVRSRFILAHSIPLGTTELIMLPDVTPDNEFWATNILSFGRAAA